MSTTFGIRIKKEGETKTIEVARRVSRSWGAEMTFTNDLSDVLSDDLLVVAMDNSHQGINTIGDIRNHIKNQDL